MRNDNDDYLGLALTRDVTIAKKIVKVQHRSAFRMCQRNNHVCHVIA